MQRIPALGFAQLDPAYSTAFDEEKVMSSLVAQSHYRRLESLQEYILIAQDKARVEQFVRQGNQWVLTEISHLNDTVRLASIDCHLTLREIYDKVEFPILPQVATGSENDRS